MMKKNRIYTTSIREIKKSFKRFCSLLIMSLLGVGVFVGIKMAAPNMMKSLDFYYDKNNVYDIKIISTLGLTEEDISALNKMTGIKAYGSYSKDVLIQLKEKEIAIKVVAMTHNINQLALIEGSLPQKDNEIVVEEDMMIQENIKIGDKIVFLDEETFQEKTQTIVGVVKSPLYISRSSRGNTTIGSGKLEYYAYVLESNFKIPYYTEGYLKIEDAQEKLTESKEYIQIIEQTIHAFSSLKEDREQKRYEEIYNKIKDEITKQELEGKEKLNQAKSILDKTYSQLKNAKKSLDSSLKKLNSTSATLKSMKIKLEETKLLLEENKRKLDQTKIEIETAKEKLDQQLKDSGLTLEDLKQINDKIQSIEIPQDNPNYDEMMEVLKSGLSLILKDYLENPQNFERLIQSILVDDPNYDEIVKILEFSKQNMDILVSLKEAFEKIKKQEEEYNKGIFSYETSLKAYQTKYAQYVSYSKEYQNGLAAYNKGMKEYNQNFQLYHEKVLEYEENKKVFEKEIEEAIKALEEIPESKWIVSKRSDDQSYSNFINNGKSVSNLSIVFPTIFFIVAILISLISMSRMVEDDRIVIGTLKSLGFENKDIRKKYLLYSGISTLLGGILGALLGFFGLSKFIWDIYKILFDIPVFQYDFNPINALLGIFIAMFCICGTTLLTIRKVVCEKPSDLMRPKAPENGKRVLLEHLPFLWNRIRFSNKVTIRNLFRYKKRVFMTVGGIMGCTALMLTGFGIRDSIAGIPEKQYKQVFHFDEMALLTGDINEKTLDEAFKDPRISNRLSVHLETSFKISSYDVQLFIPEKEENIKDILELRDVASSSLLNLEEDKVILSSKLAHLIHKKVGDTITMVDSNYKEYSFVISGICENYVGHYVFMNFSTYEKNIRSFTPNVVYFNIFDMTQEEEIITDLLKKDSVMSVLSVDLTMHHIDDMLSSLNSVVVILILLSGSLSFVVLYNLSYINISERKREIATLKVLGFKDQEVDHYITKEILILTFLGIILGLFFGTFLINIIMDTIEIENLKFLHYIANSSFLITSLMILLFTLIVNRIIHYALKKIDMIESLKSVE